MRNVLFQKNTSKFDTLSNQKIVTVNTLHIKSKTRRLLLNSKWWSTHPRCLFLKLYGFLTSEAMRARRTHTRNICLKGCFLPNSPSPHIAAHHRPLHQPSVIKMHFEPPVGAHYLGGGWGQGWRGGSRRKHARWRHRRLRLTSR